MFLHAIGLVALLPRAAPLARAAETWEGRTIAFGDLHVHTGASRDGGADDLGACAPGGCGTVADLVDTARANGLDFMAITDHTNGPNMADAADFEAVLATALSGHDPAAGFVVLPGGEIRTDDDAGNPLGHRNVILFGDDADLAGLAMTELSPYGDATTELASCDDLRTWMDGLVAARGPALLIPHHPAASVPMAVDWSCTADPYEVAVEVYSSHGNSMAATPFYDPVWSTPSASGSVTTALDPTGWALRLGFVGGTDGHDTRPGRTCSRLDPLGYFADNLYPYGGGLTAAVLDEGATLSRLALHDAIAARHTYATTGPMMPLAVHWLDDAGNELGGMGDVLARPASGNLKVRLTFPPAWTDAVIAAEIVLSSGLRLDLFQVNRGQWERSVPAPLVPDHAYLRIHLDGDVVWGAGTCDDGGADSEERTWTSPTWFA